MKNYLLKILRWYFSKQALPYWCLMLTDFAIIFISAVVTFWLFEKSQHLFDQRIDVFFTALVYALLSFIGARAFRTYQGVVRYSSFVDLMKVAYANGLTTGGLSDFFGSVADEWCYSHSSTDAD